VPLFLFIVVGYSHTKQAVPIPLLIVGLIYFLGSLLMFVTQELLFHQKNYRRLMLNDYCSAIVLIISFQIFTLVEFSVAVGVLLSFFSSFIFVGSINASILIRAVKDSEPSSWFSRISDKTLTKRKNRFFLQITLFGNFLERGDKMVLVFLVDPSTFAKFTFNIAPFVVLRFVPQLFMKLTLSRRFEDNLRRINFVGMILLYTGFGVVFSIIIGQTLKNLQGGMWFIGFAPLFAFLFYETLRIVYSLILTRDISLGSTEIHHRISRLGMFALPIQFILCLLAAPNNLTIAYFVSASFIASAIVGLAFYRNRLAEDSNSV
jgi:hypothetical protein